MVRDCYEKIKSTNIQRYYILSTSPTDETEQTKIDELITKIKNEHGCQIIVNGVFSTIRYYLRLLTNTDEFMDNYLENLITNTEVKHQHKISWNKIVNEEE